MSMQAASHEIPDSLRRDGWWLATGTGSDIKDAVAATGTSGEAAPRGTATDGPPRNGTVRPRAGDQRSWRPLTLALVVALTALADLLFWGHWPGISVAVFALALSAAILAAKPGGATRREWTIALAFTVACNLPVIEYMQALSVLFSLGGVVTILTWASFGKTAGWRLGLRTFLRASVIGPFGVAGTLAGEIRNIRTGSGTRRSLLALVMPVVVGSAFVALLTSANPLIADAVSQIVRLQIPAEHLSRATFWLVVASLVWPYVNPLGRWRGGAAAPTGTNRHVASEGTVHAFAAVVNPASVRNSLVLFNMMFLVQTVLDIGVLTGGMALPEGVTYAQYAHRGAYPLVATALLAALFAIATHRMIADSRFLRGLMYLWLGQNMFLVFTAAFRLNHYVAAYALTHLRVAAFIWMGLVFVGLVLTVVTIYRGRSLDWLIRANLISLTATLYACCFVNFTHVIAETNLKDIDGADLFYVCRLGEQAIPAIDDAERRAGKPLCARGGSPFWRGSAPIEDWREWSFRRWRLQVYLDAHPIVESDCALDPGKPSCRTESSSSTTTRPSGT